MIDYSKHMKPLVTYEWQIKAREEQMKKAELEKIEADNLAAIRKREEDLRTEEFVKQFLNHPLSDEMIEQLKLIESSKRKKVDPVYILDKRLNIVAIAESKNLVGKWLYKNGHSKKVLGRTTIFEYIRNSWEYKNMFYFVEAKNFEKFINNIA